MKRSHGIAVFGSTGSIGTHTLELVGLFPDKFHVVALSAGKNLDKLTEQIKRHKPQIVSVSEPSGVESLKSQFPHLEVVHGEEGLHRCVEAEGTDIRVMGIVGFAALSPTLLAIKKGGTLALASKEVLVVAGHIVEKALREAHCRLIPIDSEHNALFQLLEKVDRAQVQSLILTASGGPLLRRSEIALEDVTPQLAINHPNWKMGAKISVDSATMMNKALEWVEAHYLFGVPAETIQIWVHPQSIVHGAIQLTDNSYLAQMSKPDMKSSIGLALSYPDRLTAPIPPLDWFTLSKLEFLPVDEKRFPSIPMVRHALEAGQTALIGLNAANEVAIEAFLQGEILFPQMASVIEEVLGAQKRVKVETVDDVVSTDKEARAIAYGILKKFRMGRSSTFNARNYRN